MHNNSNYNSASNAIFGCSIWQAASDAMDIIISTIADVDERISALVKVFALNAFHNILSIRAGRLDFLDTKSIREAGDERQKAIERYLHGRLSIFTR